MNARTRNLVIAAAVVVVLLAVVAVLAAGGGGGDDDTTTSGTGASSGSSSGGSALQQYQAVEVGGTALPEFSSTKNDRAVGRAVPQLTGRSFDGTPVRVENDGKPKLLLFLAHWCPHCQREVPVVRDWLAAGNGKNIAVYSISTAASSDRPNWPPSAWLARERWTVPVLADDQDSTAATKFGLTAFPYFVFVNSDGTVAVRGSGELSTDDLNQLVARVK